MNRSNESSVKCADYCHFNQKTFDSPLQKEGSAVTKVQRMFQKSCPYSTNIFKK